MHLLRYPQDLTRSVLYIFVLFFYTLCEYIICYWSEVVWITIGLFSATIEVSHVFVLKSPYARFTTHSSPSAYEISSQLLVLILPDALEIECFRIFLSVCSVSPRSPSRFFSLGRLSTFLSYMFFPSSLLVDPTTSWEIFTPKKYVFQKGCLFWSF